MKTMSASNQDVSVFSSPLTAKRSPRAVSQLRIRELRTWEGLPELKNAWNELLARSAAPTVSPPWEWMQSWWASRGPGHELKLLFCTDAAGEVAAILPLMRFRKQILPGISALVLRLIGDGFADFENLDWIVRRGCESAVVREVLDWLEGNALEWDILALNTVPASSPVATELREQMAEREWRVVGTESCSHILPLPIARMACARPFSRGACALVMAQSAERGKDWLRAHIFEVLQQSYRRLRRAKPLKS